MFGFLLNTFSRNKNDKESSLVVLALSVAVFADREINNQERRCVIDILTSYCKQDMVRVDMLYSLVEKRIASYERDFALFLKEKTEVVQEIVENGNWALGKMIQKIILSDGIVKKEEDELLQRIIEFIRAKEAVLESISRAHKEMDVLVQKK